jgi:hypothetical protein
MYALVFNAGLEIVERRAHSYVINFYENIDGFDATVFRAIWSISNGATTRAAGLHDGFNQC